MLKHVFSAAVFTTLYVLPLQAAEVGKPAPAFEVKDIDGKAQSIAQYKGKIVVLEWNNPECPFVKKHYGSGNMQKLQEYALSKGVVWLSVDSSASGKEGYMDEAAAKAKITEVGAHDTAYILDHEGELGKLYGAKATPHMFVVDDKGNLAYEGAIDDKPTPDPEDIKRADNYVKDAIDALQAGKPVAVAQTRAYGCFVKYKD
jgi:peroxiredoxin